MSKFKLQLPSAPVRDLDPATDLAYQAVADKVGTYSITPRTLVSKTLLASGLGDIHPARSVEEYEYCGSNKVLRFCINAELIGIDPAGTILGEGRTVPKAPTGSATICSPGAAKAAILHTVEKTLITEAIRHLHGTGGGAGARTVLADIFERENGAPIKIDPSSGHPLTHTVVLHRGLSTVQVIDPSNFANSVHLANDDFNAVLTTYGLPSIETICTTRHGAIQIYKPDSAVGTAYTPHQYRNCTDAAVKLAFGFNKTAVPLVFDKDGIVTHPVVIHVSNNGNIDKEIVVQDKPVRIKQDSSLTAQGDFAKVQHAIYRKLGMLEHKVDKDALRQEYTRTINDTSHHNILKNLIRLNDNVNQQLSQQLASEHSDIISDFQSYETELSGASTSPQ